MCLYDSVYAAINKTHARMEKTRVAYNLMCGDDWVIYISTTATSAAVCASAVANADCDCSAGVSATTDASLTTLAMMR